MPNIKLYFKSYSGDREGLNFIVDTLSKYLPNGNIGIYITDFDDTVMKQEGKTTCNDSIIGANDRHTMQVNIYNFLNTYKSIQVLPNLIYYFYKRGPESIHLKSSCWLEKIGRSYLYDTIIINDEIIAMHDKNVVYALYSVVSGVSYRTSAGCGNECSHGYHSGCQCHNSLLEDYKAVTQKLQTYNIKQIQNNNLSTPPNTNNTNDTIDTNNYQIKIITNDEQITMTFKNTNMATIHKELTNMFGKGSFNILMRDNTKTIEYIVTN